MIRSNAAEAEPGDACGIILELDDIPFCPGTLQAYVDVKGRVPDCTCHLAPPCKACTEAPLVCDCCDTEIEA